MRTVAGCVCWDESKILIITSRKNKNKWVLPKGGVEKEETSEIAAIRELYEEAGIRATKYTKLHEMRMERKTGEQNSVWYSCQMSEILDEWPEKNDRLRKFVTVLEAGNLLKNDYLPVLNAINDNKF
eukprot:NODE_120_length_17920_cov_0.559782.p16 type:complete len:127 gc:universal NODE_120_length_17920_cov_0.559782:1360-1740(+)